VHFLGPLLPGLAWIDARRRGRPTRWGRWTVVTLPYLAISAAAIAINMKHQLDVGAIYGWGDASPGTVVRTVSALAVRGLLLLAVPVGLSAEYPRVIGAGSWMAVPVLAAVLAVGAVAVARVRRSGPAVLFVVLAWLPVSNLLALPNPMADRYLFLPSLGLAALLGLGLERRRQAVVAGVLAVLLVCFGALTLVRMRVWTDRGLLWTDAVRKAPSSARAHQNLGEVRLSRGQMEAAFDSFDRMLEVEPGVGDWYVYVAGKYEAKGDASKAEAILREGLRRVPSYPGTRINLARMLVRRVRGSPDPDALLDQAEGLLREIVDRTDPTWMDARFRGVARLNLGVIACLRGRFPVGIEAFRAALGSGLRPPDELLARRNLARALREIGREEEARAEEARVGVLEERLGLR
jgi:tetratricopeptide (TPR) repeat protein